jgi:hypothetical protein
MSERKTVNIERAESLIFKDPAKHIAYLTKIWPAKIRAMEMVNAAKREALVALLQDEVEL